MKFLTKEWYNLRDGSQFYLMLSVAKPAETFSEEYFQKVYQGKLNQYFRLQKEISELTADDLFPPSIWDCLIVEDQDLSQEELDKLRDNIIRNEEEMYNNYIPIIYDEEVLKKQFYENRY